MCCCIYLELPLCSKISGRYFARDARPADKCTYNVKLTRPPSPDSTPYWRSAQTDPASSPHQAGSSACGSFQKKLPQTLQTIAQSLPVDTKMRVLFQDEGR